MAVCEEGFLINSQHKFYVDSTPLETNRTWLRIAKGINDFDDSLNESTEEYYPIAYDGAGASVVLSILFSITFTGHRYTGDPAQDYILGQAFTVGIGRETNLIWQLPNLDGYIGKVVMSKIGPPKGGASNKGDFEVEFKLYGNPSYIGSPVAPLNLISTGQTNKNISLQWDATTTEGTGFLYNVYRNGVLIDQTENTTYTDVDLTANTTYSYYVTVFTPLLVESEASNVITPSTENPILVVDFTGKITTSTIENPNIFWTRTNQTSLAIPSQIADTISQVAIDSIKTLNNVVDTRSTTTNLAYGQHVFSYDLIKDTERAFGTIPGATTLDKVNWLKANISFLQYDWNGWGSGPSGNGVTAQVWSSTSNLYEQATSHSAGVITPLGIISSGGQIVDRIDSNGFTHFLVNAQASNGSVASSIRSDYAKLTITYVNTP